MNFLDKDKLSKALNSFILHNRGDRKLACRAHTFDNAISAIHYLYPSGKAGTYCWYMDGTKIFSATWEEMGEAQRVRWLMTGGLTADEAEKRIYQT